MQLCQNSDTSIHLYIYKCSDVCQQCWFFCKMPWLALCAFPWQEVASMQCCALCWGEWLEGQRKFGLVSFQVIPKKKKKKQEGIWRVPFYVFPGWSWEPDDVEISTRFMRSTFCEPGLGCQEEDLLKWEPNGFPRQRRQDMRMDCWCAASVFLCTRPWSNS